jgi:phosphohistidine phosphatase
VTDDPTASTPAKPRAPAKPRVKTPVTTPAKPRVKTRVAPQAGTKGPGPELAVARPTGESSSIETDRPREVSLYLLRHADAGDPMAWTGDDAERPLSKKGRRQSKRVGRLLADLDVRPDVILTSPKVRSAETAKLVGRLVGRRPATDDRLALAFGGTALAGLVAGLGNDVTSVMLVGHDPDFSTTLSWLVGGSLTLPKGALAAVVLPDGQPAAGRGILRWLLPPDAIPG